MSKNEITLIPTTAEMETYQIMAKKAASTHFFNRLGGEAAIFSIMIMARELGVPPMQAIMGGMNVIQGKVEISPRLMNQMIREKGHAITIQECTNAICKIKGTRHDTKEEYIAEYSIEEAQKAGLVKAGGGWDKYPSDMLFARCISRLARRLYPDVISSAYVDGEIDANGGGNGNGTGTPPANEETTPKVVTEPKTLDDLYNTLSTKERIQKGMSPIALDLYLDALAESSSASKGKIIAQALEEDNRQRFCNSFFTWYDNQHN